MIRLSTGRADTVMEWYYKNGKTLVALSDDIVSGSNLGSALYKVACPNPGQVYIRVRQFDPTIFGPETQYELAYGETAARRVAAASTVALSTR